jgi:hypothetical protein
MMVHDDRGLNNKEMLSALIQSYCKIQDDLIHQATWLDQGVLSQSADPNGNKTSNSERTFHMI